MNAEKTIQSLVISAILLAASSLTACSSLRVTPISKDKALVQEGVRFYGSLPYLLVTNSLVIQTESPTLVQFDNQKNKFVPFQKLPIIDETSQAASGSPGASEHIQRSNQSLQAYTVLPVSFGGSAGDGQQVGVIKPNPVLPGGPGAQPPTPPSMPSMGPQNATSPPSPISVIYMPDPCREYAVTQKNFLSSQSIGVTLNDGWQLTNLQATSDTTGVVNSLIGTVGSVLGGGSAKSAGGPASSAPGGPIKSAQGGLPVLFIQKITYTLDPGVYPLFKRIPRDKTNTSLDECDGMLHFENPLALTAEQATARGNKVNVELTPFSLKE